jgi:hypothetical protein
MILDFELLATTNVMPDHLNFAPTGFLPGWLVMLFRRESDDDTVTTPVIDEGEADSAKIRCPHCRWRPSRLSLWTCWDCDYPEYFYDGCGTDWNTFETSGQCPGCSHQWIWTSCLQCGGWAKHEDWYASEQDPNGKG